MSRLNEHTQYLRTLGGKLSHELRTPLTIVRSSLDNLESEGLQSEQQRYITRAREGTQRLQTILAAIETVRGPLNDFYGSLSDKQKTQFNMIGRPRATKPG